MNQMTKIRTYLQYPAFPLSIHIIGCGGTGSHFVMLLARMLWAYNKLFERRRIHIVLWDGDTVSETNVSRQLFLPDEVNLNKAEALVTRYNTMYGFEWIAMPVHFTKQLANRLPSGNIYLSFVDNVKSRRVIDSYFKESQKLNDTDDYEYAKLMWIDAGNTASTSNVFLSLYGQKTIIDRFPDLQESPDTPSCSTVEALQQQNLFINVFTADIVANLLWDAIYEGRNLPNIVYFNNDFLNIKKVYETADNSQKSSKPKKRLRIPA